MTRLLVGALLLLPIAGCGAGNFGGGSGQQCQIVRSGNSDHGGRRLSCATRAAALQPAVVAAVVAEVA